MQMFKPAEADLEALQSAAKRLKRGNAMFAIAKKETESAKQTISDWLMAKRETNLETLAIGDMICIEGVVLIEMSSMNKFDESTFLAANPALHEAFKRDIPVKRFKPLV